VLVQASGLPYLATEFYLELLAESSMGTELLGLMVEMVAMQAGLVMGVMAASAGQVATAAMEAAEVFYLVMAAMAGLGVLAFKVCLVPLGVRA